MSGKVIKSILIVLILIQGLLQIIPECAEAQGPPSIQIIFDESVVEIDVRPGSPCNGILTGRVISDEPIRDVEINLMASTDQGWPCTVDPATMIVPPRSEVPFTIEVTVSVETSYYTSGTLTLSGTCTYYPGSLRYSISPITRTIRIRQYSRFYLNSPKPCIETQPGAHETFEVGIINEGNAREIYNIEHIEGEKLDQDGFTVTLSLRQLEIDERDNRSFEVKVTIPSSMSSISSHSIQIQVTPENLEIDDAHSQTYTLVVKVTEEKIVFTTEFQIIFVIILAAIIASVIYTIRRRKRNKLKVE